MNASRFPVQISSGVHLDDENQRKIPNFFLYFTALTASIASFSAGAAFVWTSPVLPKLMGQLKTNDTPLSRNITPSEAAACTSLFFCGAAVCSLFCGWWANVIGRKNTLVISAIPAVAGFLLIAFGDHLAYFYVGRSLNGFNLGSVYTVIPVYLSEIAEKSNRDLISCFPLIFITVGMVFNFCLGPYVTIKTMSLVNVAPLGLFVFVFEIFGPESPYHLVSKGKTQRARLSLMQLRKNDIEVVGRELAQICGHVQDVLGQTQGLRCGRGCGRFCVAVGLVVIHGLSGIDFLLCYMQWIFEESRSGFPSEISSIIVGLVLWFTVIISTFLVGRFNEKFMLVVSAIGTTVCLLTAGTYFLLKERNFDVTRVNWLLSFSLAVFVMFHFGGIGPMPFAIIGGAFPPNRKMAASALTIFVALAVAFLTIMLLPFSCDTIGISYTIFILAGFCLLGGVYNYAFLPPAKGRQLESTHRILLTPLDNSESLYSD